MAVTPTLDLNNLVDAQGASGNTTWYLNPETRTVTSNIDGLLALQQTISAMLAIERGRFAVYSTDFGVEVCKYIGLNRDEVVAGLKKTIFETLMTDKRVVEVSDFQVHTVGVDAINITFTVNSVYGSFGYGVLFKQ